jgi:hypothetical protein
VSSFVVEVVAGPRSLQHLDGLLEEVVALVEVDAEGGELGAEVAGADHERGAAAGQDVDGRHRLGGEERVAVRHDGQRRHEPEATGDGGHEPEAHERIDGLVAAVVQPLARRRRVVGEGDAVDAGLFSGPGEGGDVGGVEPRATVELAVQGVLEHELHRGHLAWVVGLDAKTD